MSKPITPEYVDGLERIISGHQQRILQLTGSPLDTGTVIAVLPAPRKVPTIGAGTKVRIVRCHDKKFIGQYGTVVDGSEVRGHRLVETVEGERVNVLVSDEDPSEFEIVGDADADPRFVRAGETVRYISGPKAGYETTVHRGVDERGYILVGDSGGTARGYVGIPPDIQIIGAPTGYVAISYAGKTLLVEAPSGIELTPGQAVTLSVQNQQIVGIAPIDQVGPVASVLALPKDGTAEVRWRDGIRTVYASESLGKLKPGDRLVLDPNATVAVSKLPSSGVHYELLKATGVTFADVIGQAEAKRKLRNALVRPLRKPAGSGGKLPRGKGLLLYGPEGCGKTLLAKAAVAEMSIAAGKQVHVLYVRGPELLRGIVGETEEEIRGLFAYARQLTEETGIPTVIVLDECDALLKRRGTGVSSDVNDTNVPMFLSEMDGFQDSGCFCLLLTNRLDILDDAVIRPGRMDATVLVGRPDRVETEELFRYYLQPSKITLDTAEADVATLATWCRDLVFGEPHALYSIKLPPAKDGEQPRTELMTVGDVGSGAVVANILARANEFSEDRWEQGGYAGQAAVTRADISAAVDELHAELLKRNLDTPLGEFTRNLTDNLMETEIVKLRQQR